MIEKGAATDFVSSGDSALDQHFAAAKAALKAGDADAAVAILDRTLARAYHFIAAWHLYGLAQEALGRNEDAATAWRQCLDLDPDDRCGARFDLARIGAIPAGPAAPTQHSEAPALALKATLARICNDAGTPFWFDTVYDLGCGTGAVGEAIRENTRFLAGCDALPDGIERAQAKLRDDGQPLYDKLAVAAPINFLVSRPEHSADLVIAADGLEPMLVQSARVLRRGGLLALAIPRQSGEGVVAGQGYGVAHAQDRLREQLEGAGLTVLCMEPVSTRQEPDVIDHGLIVVARRI